MLVAVQPVLNRILRQTQPFSGRVRFSAHPGSETKSSVRFGQPSKLQFNPFVFLLDKLDQGREQLKQTPPGKFLSQGFSKVNGWLKAAPKPAKSDSKSRPSSKPSTPELVKPVEPESKPSPEAEKIKAFLRKINPTLQGQNPFVSLLNGIDKLRERFSQTEGGKWTAQRLSTVNNWLKDSSKKTTAPIDAKSKTPSKPIPTIEEITQKIETYPKSATFERYDKMPLSEVETELSQTQTQYQTLQTDLKKLKNDQNEWLHAVRANEASLKTTHTRLEEESRDSIRQRLQNQQHSTKAAWESAKQKAITVTSQLNDAEQQRSILETQIRYLKHLRNHKRQDSVQP